MNTRINNLSVAKRVGFTLILLTGLLSFTAVTTQAQWWPNQRDNGGYRGRDDRNRDRGNDRYRYRYSREQVYQFGMENGMYLGKGYGEEDRYNRRHRDPERTDAYKRANYGYRKEYGDFDTYRDGFRNGFQRGYYQAVRSGWGRNDRNNRDDRYNRDNRRRGY